MKISRNKRETIRETISTLSTYDQSVAEILLYVCCDAPSDEQPWVYTNMAKNISMLGTRIFPKLFHVSNSADSELGETSSRRKFMFLSTTDKVSALPKLIISNQDRALGFHIKKIRPSSIGFALNIPEFIEVHSNWLLRFEDLAKRCGYSKYVLMRIRRESEWLVSITDPKVFYKRDCYIDKLSAETN